jgi:hypothetical protein
MDKIIEAVKRAHDVLQSGDMLCEVTAASILREAIAAEEALGVVAIAWLVQCKSSGLVEQAEPNEKATNPEQWTDAFPVFTHPAPPPTSERAALIAKLRDVYAADMLSADANDAFAAGMACRPASAQQVAEPTPTGWDNGLSQDYCKGLGQWLANRPGARQQLREMMAADHVEDVRAMVPMTEEQIDELATVHLEAWAHGCVHGAVAYTRAIEAHHGIK